ISTEYRAIAEAMVYHALTAEVMVGPGRSIPGLGTCSLALREMEFLFPYPEEGHPPLSEPVPGKLVVERGFIKGFVDLVVEHAGLVYFADWKSDVLPSYGPREIEAHVQAHYALQAKLYAMALVKALGIHSESEYNARFGGLVYAFLRGLRSGAGQGVGLHFARPRWADILRDEDEVRRFGARAVDRGGE
ncbi:PDDEXK family nuclease, partial [Singulisphaera rosea]